MTKGWTTAYHNNQSKLVKDLSSVMKRKRIENTYFAWSLVFALLFVSTMMIPLSLRSYIPSRYLQNLEFIVKSEEFMYSLRGLLLGIGCFLFYLSKYPLEDTVGIDFYKQRHLLGLDKMGVHSRLDGKDADSKSHRKGDSNDENERSPLTRSSPSVHMRMERSSPLGRGTKSANNTIKGGADEGTMTGAQMSTAGSQKYGNTHGGYGSLSESGFTNRSRYSGEKGPHFPNKFGFGSPNRDLSVVDGGPRSQISYNSNVNKSTKWSHYDHHGGVEGGTSIYYDQRDSGMASTRMMMNGSARGAFHMSSPDRSTQNSTSNFSMNRDMNMISPGSWQNSPIDNSQILAAERASKKNHMDALAMLGIDVIDESYVDKLKRVLGTHAQTTIQSFEKYAIEIVKKLEQAIKTPQYANKIRPSDIEVITSLLLLEISSGEVFYQGGRPTLLTLWKLMEDLHGKDFQSMLNPTPPTTLGSSTFGTGLSFGAGFSASTFGTGSTSLGAFGSGTSATGQQQQSKCILNEYESCLELFLFVGHDLSHHTGVRTRSAPNNGAAQGIHLMYSNDELAQAVDVAVRMRYLTRNDQQFNKYKWVGSPDKSHRSSSSSLSVNNLGNSSIMEHNVRGFGSSDSELIMGVFLHYADSMSPSKHNREGRFSDKFFAEDPQLALRHLRSVLKQYNQIENSHIDMQMMPCITRTSLTPPHFDIFFATQSIDDYGDNDPDELSVEDWKVKPGRLNVFHTIIIFLVSCIWSQDASVQKVVRDLWKSVFSIHGTYLSNPERVEKSLIDKGLLAPRDDGNIDNISGMRNSFTDATSKSGFVPSSVRDSTSFSGYNRSW